MLGTIRYVLLTPNTAKWSSQVTVQIVLQMSRNMLQFVAPVSLISKLLAKPLPESPEASQMSVQRQNAPVAQSKTRPSPALSFLDSKLHFRLPTPVPSNLLPALHGRQMKRPDQEPPPRQHKSQILSASSHASSSSRQSCTFLRHHGQFVHFQQSLRFAFFCFRLPCG